MAAKVVVASQEEAEAAGAALPLWPARLDRTAHQSNSTPGIARALNGIMPGGQAPLDHSRRVAAARHALR